MKEILSYMKTELVNLQILCVNLSNFSKKSRPMPKTSTNNVQMSKMGTKL